MINYIKSINYSISHGVYKLIERAKMTEHTFMLIIAIIIGILAGFGAMAIREMIKLLSELSYPGDDNLLKNIINSPWYVKIFIPVLGGAIVGPIIYFFAKEAKGHGVPEVMQALLMKNGTIRPRVAIIKAIASSITIGTGGSVGREGPIVQIGSSIGSSVAQFFRVSPERMKTFVGCGAAAGIAAAFNAPIAGSLFAVEIIMRDFGFTQFSPIVIASVMATVVSHYFEGNFAAFQVPTYHLTSPYEILFYFLLGVLCAIVSYAFIKALYFSEELFDERLKLPEYLKPAIGGLIIGIIALIFPEIMGVGYESINDALHGKLVWHLAFILIFIKIFSTSATLGSGGSGGIFAPSLFMGAMLGCAFGWLVHTYFPNITSTPGAYALVAMGGLVAGTTHAPITAIIIVFELTNDYQIILPLMVTCIISTILSSKLSRESIYTLKLLLRNIHIKDGAEINIMKSIYVKDVYTPNAETITEKSNFNQIVSKLISGKDPYLLVTGPKKMLVGIIAMNDIKAFLFEKDMLQHIVIAKDIAIKDVVTVTLKDNCFTVQDIISKNGWAGLPVVDSSKPKKILGMIWRKDILEAYNKEIESREITSTLASKISMSNLDQKVHFMEGYEIAEIKPPESFIGKTIKGLNIRNKYGVDIILIRTKTDHDSKLKAIPSPDYRISSNDTLVVVGEIGKINLLHNLS